MRKIEMISEPDFARASDRDMFQWIKRLVEAHNEMVDYLEQPKKEITGFYDNGLSECQHLNTYPFGRNKQMKKCRDCGKIIK